MSFDVLSIVPMGRRSAVENCIIILPKSECIVKFLRVGTLDSAGISSVSEVSSTFFSVSVFSLSILGISSGRQGGDG